MGFSHGCVCHQTAGKPLLGVYQHTEHQGWVQVVEGGGGGDVFGQDDLAEAPAL